jgi:hypothetical protein
MKRLSLLIAAALVIALPASAKEKETVRSFDKKIPTQGVKAIDLDFPVGEMEVEGWSQSEVEARVEIRCENRSRRCLEAARKVELVANTEGERLSLHLKDWPRGSRGMQIFVRVSVPQDLPLKAELGVGELTIQGIEADLDADLGVGEVNVTMSEGAVHSVHLDAGIGEANLRAGGRWYENSGLMVSALKWREGSGQSNVEVDLGVGEINVVLKK